MSTSININHEDVLDVDVDVVTVDTESEEDKAKLPHPHCTADARAHAKEHVLQTSSERRERQRHRPVRTSASRSSRTSLDACMFLAWLFTVLQGDRMQLLSAARVMLEVVEVHPRRYKQSPSSFGSLDTLTVKQLFVLAIRDTRTSASRVLRKWASVLLPRACDKARAIAVKAIGADAMATIRGTAWTVKCAHQIVHHHLTSCPDAVVVLPDLNKRIYSGEVDATSTGGLVARLQYLQPAFVQALRRYTDTEMACGMQRGILAPARLVGIDDPSDDDPDETETEEE